MKLYELTFTDPEQGFIRQWRRNLRQIDALLTKWATDYPMRELIDQQYVDVPEGKSEFVEWLNENAMRK